jgi:hypothetical protein
LLTLYTQQVLRYTALEAGVAYLPLAAGVASATGVANKLAGRVGPRPLAVPGLATPAVGMLALGHAPAAADYWTQILPGMVIVRLGASLSFISISAFFGSRHSSARVRLGRAGSSELDHLARWGWRLGAGCEVRTAANAWRAFALREPSAATASTSTVPCSPGSTPTTVTR